MFQLQEDSKSIVHQWKRDHPDRVIRILCVGGYGAGKSTLINGMLGETRAVVSIGPLSDGHGSRLVEKYSGSIDGTPVILYDTDGVVDFSAVARRCSEGIDIILICYQFYDRMYKLVQTRILKKLQQSIGDAVWERTVIALTQANVYPAEWYEADAEIPANQMPLILEDVKRSLSDYMVNSCGVNRDLAYRIPYVPVGYYKPGSSRSGKELPLTDDWRAQLMTACCQQYKEHPIYFPIPKLVKAAAIGWDVSIGTTVGILAGLATGMVPLGFIVGAAIIVGASHRKFVRGPWNV